MSNFYKLLESYDIDRHEFRNDDDDIMGDIDESDEENITYGDEENITYGDDDLDTSTDNRSLSGLKKLFNYMKR